MIKRLILVLFTFICLLNLQCNAEDVDTDNLKKRIENTSSQEKYELIIQYVELVYESSPQEARDYLENAFELCERNDQFARCYELKGLTYWFDGDYSKAIENYISAEEFYNKSNNIRPLGKLYYRIGKAYNMMSEYRNALIYHKKALDYIDAPDDFSDTYANIGLTLYHLGEFDDALEYANKALKVCIETDDELRQAGVYNNIGLIYSNKGDYEKAIEYQIKALTINEKLGDDIAIANSYTNIGVVYYYLKYYENAIEYYEKAKVLWEKIGQKSAVAGMLNNIGLIYEEQNNYNKALEFYNRAASVIEQLPTRSDLAMAYNNIGKVLIKMKKWDKALENYTKSLEIRQEIDDKNGIALSMMQIGKFHTDQKNYNVAEDYLQKSMNVATEMGARQTRLELLKAFSELEKSRGDFQNSIRYIEMYMELKDSIFTGEKNEQIARMQTKYDTEKKEKEIELLKQDQKIRELELKEQRNIRNFLYIIVGFMVVLAVIIIRSNRMKQRANKLLEKQNKEIKKQSEELSFKNSQITSSINYARKIQQAVLPDTNLIDKLIENNFILYKPRDIVSGDFYWVKKINSKTIVLAADCTGHGVPGAFMSMLGITLLNEIVKSGSLETSGKTLDKLRTYVVEALGQKGMIDEFKGMTETFSSDSVKDGMDVSLCILDSETNEIQFSGANNPLFIVSEGNKINVNGTEVQSTSSLSELQQDRGERFGFEIKGDKMPIGIHKNMDSFSTKTITISGKATLYLFSDGYGDQFGGPHGKKFRAPVFRDNLLINSDMPMLRQKQILEKEITDWMKGYEEKYDQIDDILVIGFELPA